MNNFDFRLTDKAIGAIDQGVILYDLNGKLLIPNYQYKKTADKEERSIKGNVDIGAYECCN